LEERYASNFKANQSKKCTAILKPYGTGLTENLRENFSVLSYMDGNGSRTNFQNLVIFINSDNGQSSK